MQHSLECCAEVCYTYEMLENLMANNLFIFHSVCIIYIWLKPCRRWLVWMFRWFCLLICLVWYNNMITAKRNESLVHTDVLDVRALWHLVNTIFGWLQWNWIVIESPGPIKTRDDDDALRPLRFRWSGKIMYFFSLLWVVTSSLLGFALYT